MSAAQTPTKKKGTAPDRRTKATGQRTDGSTSGHGIAGPDAQPQVSPTPPDPRVGFTGKDGGPGASDAPAGSPVAPQTPAAGQEGDTSLPAAGFHPTEPGIYGGIPDVDYHRHPALSSSGARALLPPSCPARFAYDREHGRPEKREFDFGHAAHAKVLGIGAELVVVQRTAKDGTKSPAEDYRSPSTGEHRDEIRAAGKVPILAKELAVVDAMADAIRAHPWASALFDPDRGGQPEQSAFWHDARYDVDRRARFDWLPALRPDGRLIVPDYKTSTCAERGAFANSVKSYGYHVQDVWYRDAIRDLGLTDDVAFVFVAQEKQAPFLINVFELDEDWLAIGRADADRALAVFAECSATDVWPPYSSDVELISPPGWMARLYEGAPA